MAGNSSNTGANSSSPAGLTKTLEEVWSDIKLSSLRDYPNIHSSSSASRPFLLHDFFSAAAPLSPPSSATLRPPSSSDSLSHTPLSSFLPSNPPFHSSPSRISSKRTRDDIHGSADPRHRRMIENRESAARSRARKQAYTNELEHELASLREENARLRRQQEKLCLRSSDRHPQKASLLRTSTAPF